MLGYWGTTSLLSWRLLFKHRLMHVQVGVFCVKVSDCLAGIHAIRTVIFCLFFLVHVYTVHTFFICMSCSSFYLNVPISVNGSCNKTGNLLISFKLHFGDVKVRRGHRSSCTTGILRSTSWLIFLSPQRQNVSEQTESRPTAGGAAESKQRAGGSGQSQRGSRSITHHNSDTLARQTDMFGMYR